MIRKTLSTAKNTAGFFIAAANSFNPAAYNGVTQRPLMVVLGYFLYLMLLLSLASFALSLPFFINDFAGLTINAEVTTKTPITSILPIPGNAKVFANTTLAPGTQQYDIILTKNELKARPALCFIRSEACRLLGTKLKATSLSGMSLNGSSGSILLLLLPGIIIFSYFFMLLKYAALAAVVALIAYALLKLARRNTSLLDAAKISLYATTAPALLELALFLLNWHEAWPIPLAAYATIVAGACMLNNGQQAGMF